MAARFVLRTVFLIVTPLYLLAQNNYVDLSIAYATHVQLAYSGQLNDLYLGKYSHAKRNYIQQLKQFAPQGDGVLDFKDISRMEDNRPRFFKILETVKSKDFTENQYLDYTSCLNSMGIYYHTMGQLHFADLLFTKCLKLRGEKFGKTNELYVASLHNLANLRRDQGRFDAADDLFKYVLRYYLSTSGEVSREYIVALNNKAMLDASIGRTNQAIEQLDKAIELSKQYEFNGESIDEIRILINRGLLANESGNSEKALQLIKLAQSMLQEKKYEDHPDYNDLIVFSGSIYMSMDSLTHFNAQIEDAVRKTATTYGKMHPFYANILELQAENNLLSGNYTVAEEQWQTIVTIREAAFSDRHPYYLKSLTRLATAKSYLGDKSVAFKYFQKAMDNYLYLADMFFRNMSENEQTKFWSTFRPNINLFYEFAIKNQNLTGVAEAVLNLQLNTKGMLLNNNRKVRDEILAGSNVELKTKFEYWQQLHAELSEYYSLSKEDLAAEEINIELLETKANELEKDLVRESQIFSSSLAGIRKKWENISALLKTNEAAVGIVRFMGTYGNMRGKAYYFANILNENNKPILVPLKDGDNLEGKYFKYYKNSVRSKIADINSYTQYWEIVEAQLKSVHRIYISADGVYNSINLATLATPSGSYLLDEKELVMVNSLGAWSQNDLIQKNNSQQSILIGNPLYGIEKIFSQLPGAEREIKDIEKILAENHITVSTLMGDAASEEAIKNIINPPILHIATHGFFLADTQSAQMVGTQISFANENPLLRSGLILAGVSTQKQGLEFENRNNGILTAYEAMNLKLAGTQLVVLSACETGLGEVVNGEGVYGLLRAFKIAGGNSIVISLWKVDDEATQVLMTSFYRLWTESNDLNKSFTEAQQIVRKKYQSPYYWGAFVLMTN